MAPRPSTLTALADEKTLQTSLVRDEEESPKVAYNKFSNEIPVLSLKGLDESEKRGEICEKIVKACEDWGGEVFQDWREIVTYFSYPIRARDYSRLPDKPQGWIAVTKKYSEKLMDLACKLQQVLSEAMGLEKEALTKACVDMDQKVVVNFYPKYQVGGLQATKGSGKTWITVQPVEGAFVVILGDHGHYLSNGRFKNADHQAVVNSSSSRLSIATFQNPATEAIVYPLKIREGEKSVMDEPITFAEMYRRKMNKDLELARLKKLAKEQQIQAKLESKPIEEILA
ncbi:unnamed protein product [Withania somnifera]